LFLDKKEMLIAEFTVKAIKDVKLFNPVLENANMIIVYEVKHYNKEAYLSAVVCYD
jgi:acetate kinase